ncbi:MAG: preprotein translocase subunit SecE [Acholeplasmataceae bacterium]|nr:preprotein translocase subunit SecE [Acholeplasmataceae bacterium]HQD92809.1 preprotein translocase subunit SecE [Bacilli bacterium]
MAEQRKENKALYILTHDFKYEGLILLFLALVAIVLGTLIVDGTLIIDETAFLIGSYPMAFAWTLIVLGAISLLLSVWPFYKPSIVELKRVSWPTQGRIIEDTITVFTFSLILAIFFFLVDLALTPLMNWFIRIGSRI